METTLPLPATQETTIASAVVDFVEKVKKRLAILFSNAYTSTPVGTMYQTASTADSGSRRRNISFKRFMKKPFFIPIILILLIVMGVVLFRNATGSSASPVLGNTDNRIDLKKAEATQNLKKEFSYPLKDEAGKEVSKLKYTIDTIEVRDEIIVEGKKATSIKGRTFLVLNLKISNTFNKPLQINARDYVRLTVNNNMNDKLAPDIHNDPVDVQAISTKLTRVAFPINDTDKNLILHVGEIAGPKEQVKLTVL